MPERPGGGAPPPPPQAAIAESRVKATASRNLLPRALGKVAAQREFGCCRNEAQSRAQRKLSQARARKPNAPGGQSGSGNRRWGSALERAAVVTVSVTCEALEPFRVIAAGEMEQLASSGAPLQLSDNGAAKLAIGVSVRVEVELCPAATLSVAGEAEREKSARVMPSTKAKFCCPLVPVTLKLKEFPVTAFRLLTVSVAVCPGWMAAGLNAQLAGALPEQARLMPPVKLEGLDAKMVNFAESTPRITVTRVLLTESW